MPRESKDARLERLEVSARSRAASRRAQRQSEKPVKLSPEEREQELLEDFEVLKNLVECGALEMPRLPRKYALLQRTFGWEFAKRARLRLPQLKWSLIAEWDKAIFRLEQRRAGAHLSGR